MPRVAGGIEGLRTKSLARFKGSNSPRNMAISVMCFRCKIIPHAIGEHNALGTGSHIQSMRLLCARHNTIITSGDKALYNLINPDDYCILPYVRVPTPPPTSYSSPPPGMCSHTVAQ